MLLYQRKAVFLVKNRPNKIENKFSEVNKK